MKYFQIYAWSDCPFHYKTKYNWETVPLIILRHTDSDEETLIGGFSDLQKYFRSTEQQDN